MQWYDKDGSGDAPEVILVGTVQLKHWQYVLEQGVHVRLFLHGARVLMRLQSVNTGLVRMEGQIVRHLYMMVLIVLGLIGVVSWRCAACLVRTASRWRNLGVWIDLYWYFLASR